MAEETAETLPRWELKIRPIANGEGHMQIEVNAGDVLCAEIAFVLSKVTTKFIQTYGQRIPTQDEVVAQQAADALLAEHPAIRLFVRNGKKLWLGKAGLIEMADAIIGSNWIDAGEVPEGVKKGCDFARDPEGVKALLGVVPPAPDLKLVDKIEDAPNK